MLSTSSNVIQIITPVFLIIAIGYLFACVRKISLEPIIDILLYLTIPALVISSLVKEPIVTTDLIQISIVAIVVVGGSGGLGYLYLRLIGRAGLRGFYMPVMFMNSGNIPFPLALLAFGATGLQVAVLYYIAISLLAYTLGMYIIKGNSGLAEIFKLPLIYATALGLAINFMGLDVSGPVITGLDMLGAATIPLMQLSLGYHLHSTKIQNLSLSITASAIRILGGFLIALLMVELLGIEGTTRSVILISSSMPSAVITFIMCYKYHVDSELAASIVAVSTLMSICTIPLLLFFIL
jgi:hypothetical protein